MIRFEDFHFKWTYGYADSIKEMICNDAETLIPIERFFENEGESFFKKACAPNKVTLLHDYIYEVVYCETAYALKKALEETLPDIYDILNTYKITFIKLKHYKGTDYKHHLLTCLKKEIFGKLTNEIFTLVYQDKQLLHDFNIVAANYIKSKKLATHQDYLASDGVLKRNTYWNTWLTNGIYCRDKGHCGICLSDLSGQYASGIELAVDHIVPLANGGTNDPTNLQLLCRRCNSKKGARSSKTRNAIPLYW